MKDIPDTYHFNSIADTGVSINTIVKLLTEAGQPCQLFHDEKVINLEAKSVQADEIWSFV